MITMDVSGKNPGMSEEAKMEKQEMIDKLQIMFDDAMNVYKKQTGNRNKERAFDYAQGICAALIAIRSDVK